MGELFGVGVFFCCHWFCFVVTVFVVCVVVWLCLGVCCCWFVVVFWGVLGVVVCRLISLMVFGGVFYFFICLVGD